MTKMYISMFAVTRRHLQSVPMGWAASEERERDSFMVLWDDPEWAALFPYGSARKVTPVAFRLISGFCIQSQSDIHIHSITKLTLHCAFNGSIWIAKNKRKYICTLKEAPSFCYNIWTFFYTFARLVCIIKTRQQLLIFCAWFQACIEDGNH